MAEAVDEAGAEAAQRYAQAAFELGLEGNALEALEADFAKLDAAFAQSADLRAAAGSPLIDPEEKTRALVAVAESLGLSPLGRNLVGAVSRNRRASALPAIARAFRARLARHRGARQAEIISAKPLTDAERASILSALEKAVGAKVEAESRVDDSLIGGFIVRLGSRQFDASIKSKLAGLKLALKTA
ncbi:MAG: ATP synthase F1 subunit delta [Alphaproteobacteria bacterium]|nr:ATP synthase F1 subunit delta [Alphaproteobacteria bacterium]